MTVEEKQIITMMQAAKRQLSEYCNAVLIVTSFDKGENAALEITTFGPSSHIMGLAQYAAYEVKKDWNKADTEESDDDI